jgi:hypothetical protein
MKNSVLFFLLMLCFTCVSENLFAQQKASQDQKTSLINLEKGIDWENLQVDFNAPKAKAGTYEFVRMKTDEYFDDKRMAQLLILVEDLRSDSDTIHFRVSDYTKILIYPRN